jgi:hypothetical protein
MFADKSGFRNIVKVTVRGQGSNVVSCAIRDVTACFPSF